jgi:putative transposase
VHRHCGIGDHTPESAHYGLAAGIREQRAAVLEAAYAAHPERSIRAKPQPPALPTGVWINAPTKAATKVQELPNRGVSSDLVAWTLRSRS